ncbi:E3 ubiquitin-protein ligase NEURL1-like [Herrania umbratica]|uniref:E3 ubiquitin-protein ligase NEURL1-like n=1 Tax=Herrania umbratica TaxID=108875 RepID=A0A6J1BMC3_9ROSI|nr:E3 ubiquitin-protein ligase NEURL1-like [Herrania umbratica]
MEQLHQEMAELRRSIMSCMDMQMKLQQWFNREVRSDGGEGKNSADRAPWKRSCCICYEVQVDSLLYRCGHMCTCLKCAHELQWSGGKCPICRAPILDVVAYQPSERVLASDGGPSAFLINSN